MAKKVAGQLKLQVKAGSATPSPPIGPALGQRGINIMEFCKAFNAQTQEMEKGSPVPVVITYYVDKSFTFVMKTPPVSYFLKKAVNLTSGSKEPGKTKVGKISRDKVREIATAKMKDLQRQRRRSRHAHGRRLRPFDGPGSGGLKRWQSLQNA